MKRIIFLGIVLMTGCTSSYSQQLSRNLLYTQTNRAETRPGSTESVQNLTLNPDRESIERTTDRCLERDEFIRVYVGDRFYLVRRQNSVVGQVRDPHASCTNSVVYQMPMPNVTGQPPQVVNVPGMGPVVPFGAMGTPYNNYYGPTSQQTGMTPFMGNPVIR